jgi:hypothetical protein
MRGSGKGIVTQAAFVDHLAPLVKPRKDTKLLSVLPVLYPYFKENDLVGLARVCVLYFLGIKDAWPEYWKDKVSLKKSLFGKTNGIAVMFMVLHDLAILLGGPNRITEETIKEYWRKAPEERIKVPPAGGGRGYQNEWYEDIMKNIVGKNYRAEVGAASEQVREKLRATRGLF